MKRIIVIHGFISLVLGIAVGGFLMKAIQNSSIIYGVFTTMVAIALMLNIFCTNNKIDDEE